MSLSSNDDSMSLLECTTTPGKLFYIKKAKKRSRSSEDDSQTPPSSPEMTSAPRRHLQRKKSSGIARPRPTPFTTLVKASFGNDNDYSFLEDLEEKVFCIEASSIEQNFEHQNFDIDDANKSLMTINFLIGQAPRETGTLHEAIVLEILEKAKKTLDSLICKKLACTLTTKDLKDSIEPFLDLKKML